MYAGTKQHMVLRISQAQPFSFTQTVDIFIKKKLLVLALVFRSVAAPGDLHSVESMVNRQLSIGMWVLKLGCFHVISNGFRSEMGVNMNSSYRIPFIE